MEWWHGKKSLLFPVHCIDSVISVGFQFSFLPPIPSPVCAKVQCIVQDALRYTIQLPLLTWNFFFISLHEIRSNFFSIQFSHESSYFYRRRDLLWGKTVSIEIWCHQRTVASLKCEFKTSFAFLKVSSLFRYHTRNELNVGNFSWYE